MNETGSQRLDTNENVSRLIQEWLDTLKQVLESMTDQLPAVRWQPVSGPFSTVGAALTAAEGGVLWWEQSLAGETNCTVWIAAQQGTWLEVATRTLQTAGLEKIERDEARNTWFEILGQSVSALARGVGTLLAREVSCEPGKESTGAGEVTQWASIHIGFAEEPLPPLLVAFSSEFLALIAAHREDSEARPAELEERHEGVAPAQPVHSSRTIDLLLDVDLPVSISFGKTHLPMKDVLKLTTGSIVELNRGVNDPVEVLVNHCLIGRGEVVVVDGNYGVRIQEIATRQDRLRSVR